MRAAWQFCVLALGVVVSSRAVAETPTLIAPIVETLEVCPATDGGFVNCKSKEPDTIPLLKTTLDHIGPKQSPDGQFELGYTLPTRLLNLYKKTDSGWTIDQAHIDAMLQPLIALDRPVVLHLSSNHFGADDNHELTAELAADPRNLMVAATGALSLANFYNNAVFPWTIADVHAPVNELRKRAIHAVLESVCKLDPTVRQRVKAVSIMGEVHHLWPNLLDGPSYQKPFVVSDYSQLSATQFHAFLRDRFHDRLALLNAETGTSFASFDDVTLPSGSLLTHAVSSFAQHIDASAGGNLAVYGWLHSQGNPAPEVLIFLDGAFQGAVTANANRSDVLEAKPEFRTPNVGFQYRLDYSRMAPGLHTLGVYTIADNGDLVELLLRDISILGHSLHLPIPAQAYDAPRSAALESHPEIQGHVDGPPPETSLIFNPLARLFLQFREQQVRTYLEYFADQAAQGCFGREMIYSHQITQSSASWNPDMAAAAQSLKPNSHYRLGVTLYGGIAFGEPFFAGLKADGVNNYGIGELNPLVLLSPDEIAAMLRRHRAAGARFIAPFFIKLTPEADISDYGKFNISPQEKSEAMRNYYSGLQQVMTSH